MTKPRALDGPMSVADLVQAVHEGSIGHAEAMARLHLTSYAELVETVHLHGLSLWGHRPVRRLPPDTLSALAAACGETSPRAAEE